MSNKTASNFKLDALGDHWIDSEIICVLTRFGLRNPLYLLPTWLDYRRTLKEAQMILGFLL